MSMFTKTVFVKVFKITNLEANKMSAYREQSKNYDASLQQNTIRLLKRVR